MRLGLVLAGGSLVLLNAIWHSGGRTGAAGRHPQGSPASIGFAAIVAAVAMRPSRILGVAPLRVLGAISLGVYLWHMPVLYALQVHDLMPETFWAALPRVLVPALALAGASWVLVERPALRWSARYTGARAACGRGPRSRCDDPAPMRRLRLALVGHLESTHVGRVVYGAIIGLALVVALQAHPPGSGTVVALIIGTAVAVGLAELYSELLGTETRTRRRPRARRSSSCSTTASPSPSAPPSPPSSSSSPWRTSSTTTPRSTSRSGPGLGLIAFYGYCAGRLAGAGTKGALVSGSSPSRSSGRAHRA